MTPQPQAKARSLIVVENRPAGLGSVSFEERRKLSAAQLIELMGPLHVNHPGYTPRNPAPLLPHRNLAGTNVIERSDYSFWGEIRALLAWLGR